ncbi:GNAT family N-acetyltransferase [Chamaesiphon sp. VAR_48_metabat_135_sub]|uniref:GNAT family N-acetyltransferase n=1 Tax=Chamaesiphon sp. VAR_48_metabat_135_sub TaxID=2964699 RepID=UPI00286C6C7A|nr:GNAT family N-acetyltransferase [Chamaesiphon sp. VAR_48_metabat_135_sub]
MSSDLTKPRLLSDSDNLSSFTSTNQEMNDWLQKHSWNNQSSGASKTYITATREGQIVGYYSIAAGAVARQSAIRSLRHNAPDPIPVGIIGRLAVDKEWSNRGIGAGLLKDAVLRIAGAAQIIGIRAIIVHSLPEALGFYTRFGFQESKLEPLLLIYPLEKISALLN